MEEDRTYEQGPLEESTDPGMLSRLVMKVAVGASALAPLTNRNEIMAVSCCGAVCPSCVPQVLAATALSVVAIRHRPNKTE